jgi:transcriptional regulator with XRE-family HTH domain
MTFAEKLRQLRDAAGLTQEQLAERSGINLWTVRGYEQGRREPSWKGILSLARALGVAAEVFADCDESATEEGSARSRGRPKRADLPPDMPAQSKPRGWKTPKPRGG